MSGYFSALAQHTGLGVASVAILPSSEFTATPNSSAATLVAAPARITPPDVEEFTFTSTSDTSDAPVEVGPREVAADVVAPTREPPSQSQLRPSAIRDEDHHRSVQAPAIEGMPRDLGKIDEFSFIDIPSAPRRPSESYLEQRLTVESGGIIESENSKPAEKHTAPREPDHAEARMQVGEDGPARAKQAASRQSVVVETPPFKSVPYYKEGIQETRATVAERQTLVRNYLKEVTEWVAQAPPLESSSLEREAKSEDTHAASSVEFAALTSREAADRKPLVKAPVPAPAASLDVQDLSLSIGTISIVVEVPATTPPMPPVAPRNVGADRSTSEPTRLSRYYLERW